MNVCSPPHLSIYCRSVVKPSRPKKRSGSINFPTLPLSLIHIYFWTSRQRRHGTLQTFWINNYANTSTANRWNEIPALLVNYRQNTWPDFTNFSVKYLLIKNPFSTRFTRFAYYNVIGFIKKLNKHFEKYWKTKRKNYSLN